MEHNFVNSGCISLIVSYLGRYDVGLPEYEINLRNIHVFLFQGVMGPGTLFLSSDVLAQAWPESPSFGLALDGLGLRKL